MYVEYWISRVYHIHSNPSLISLLVSKNINDCRLHARYYKTPVDIISPTQIRLKPPTRT